MGVYDRGTSGGQTEPVMGHPVFPPPVAFTQQLPLPLPGQGQGPEAEVDKLQKLRQKFQLDSGSCCYCCGRCEDFCMRCCCGEHRELQSRGLDPSLGWEEVAQQTTAPTPPGVMLR